MSDKQPKKLTGLQKICKTFGRMNCGGKMMAWDYANDVALPESELRADSERWNKSETAKWGIIKKQKYDQAYVDQKIAEAKPAWEGVNADEWLKEVRGQE